MKKFGAILLCMVSSLSACSFNNKVTFKKFREYAITHYQQIHYNYLVADIKISEGKEHASGLVAISHSSISNQRDGLHFYDDTFSALYTIDHDLFVLISSFEKSKVFPFIDMQLEGAKYYTGDGCRIVISKGLNKEEIVFNNKCHVKKYYLKEGNYTLKMSFAYENNLNKYA